MKRGTKCIVQTINLSNPKTCVKPKVQKLVNADADSCSYTDRTSNHRTPRPVTIKVCSRKDMQRKCPPKLRDCPEKPAPLTSGEKLCRIVIFFIKVSVVAGLVYWTHSEGLWGNSAETEDLYYRMINTICPPSPARPEDPQRLEGIRYSSVLQAYNRTVVKGMDIIVGVPLDMHRKLRDLLFPCDTKETKKIHATHSDEDSREI